MAETKFLSGEQNTSTTQQLLKGGFSTETLAGAKTLTNRSAHVQRLDPGGASRDVTLPTAKSGLWFAFYNAADAAEDLVIKNAAAATIGTISQGEFGVFACAVDGAWVNFAEFAVASAAAISTDSLTELTPGAGPDIDGSSATTGNWAFKLADNLASALVVKEAANAYLTFKTTNSAEAVQVNKTLAPLGSIDLSGNATTISKVLIADNLADALNITEGANSYLKITSTNSAELITLGVPLVFGASVDLIADPGNAGAIPVTRSGVCSLTTGAADTRTLAIPTFIGQRLGLVVDVDGGTVVITSAQAINQAGNTIITMADLNDFIELVGVKCAGGVLRWRVAANDGAALS